ncbi:MAG TPA: class I SAM-dependent methyltransferase [Flavobacteriales bacterium]
MLQRIKAVFRPWVPAVVRQAAARRRARQERERHAATERLLFQPAVGPAWLGRTELEELCRTYAAPPSYGYGADALEERGRQRAKELMAAHPEARRFLDLGCLDGMTAAALQQAGKDGHGIDLVEQLDPRAAAAGVRFRRMDAMALEYPGDHFDVVHSFNAFEHFGDPAQVLREALRVTRPGGRVHLHFGPLYGSAKGLHAYYKIPVPYCQFLFPLELMNTYLTERGVEPLDPGHCNGWTVQQFRDLWSSMRDRADILEQAEYYHTADLDIVRRFPSCFQGKVQQFDDLIVNNLRVVLRKRG